MVDLITPSIQEDGLLDAKEVGQSLLAHYYPYLLRLLKAYGESITPEGMRRDTANFRTSSMADASYAGDVGSQLLRAQGFSPEYAAGAGINAVNAARRAIAQYRAQRSDPYANMKRGLDVFGGLASVVPAPPLKPKSSFLGDVFGLAGNILPLFTGGGGGGGGFYPRSQGGIGGGGNPDGTW